MGIVFKEALFFFSTDNIGFLSFMAIINTPLLSINELILLRT